MAVVQMTTLSLFGCFVQMTTLISAWQVCVGAALHGLGMSCCFLSTLTAMSTGEKGEPSEQVLLLLLLLQILH